MSQQIKFFEKSKADLSNSNCSITVTDAVATNTGQAFVDYVRNRNNFSAWMTTGSTDAADTTLEIDFVDEWTIGEILLIGHNFKAFTIKYDDSGWTDFTAAINETTNSDSTTHFSVTPVETSKIQIIITGCQVVDAEKVLKQLIITKKLGTGQFEGWPMMRKPVISTNRRISKMLSGKVNVTEGVEAYSVDLNVRNWSSDTDLTILETIYFKRQGVLVWPCGGDADQFGSERKAYKLEDIFLMRPINEWSPEWYKGIYTSGMKINMKLSESVN